MRVLGSILGGFSEPNGLKKSVKILNAFLDAKKGDRLQIWGSARRNARAAGRDREGSDKGFGQGSGKEGKDLAKFPADLCCRI